MLASVNMGDKKPLSILEGKWMTPIYFITTLQEAGLNIFPTEYSHFYVATSCKVSMNLSKLNVMDISNASKYCI